MTTEPSVASRKRREKLRKQARNAVRQRANAASVAETLSPDDASRQAIRSQRQSRDDAEHRRAARLSAPLTEPEPDPTVVIYLDGAQRQRAKAAALEPRIWRMSDDGKTRVRIYSLDATKAHKDHKAHLNAAKFMQREADDARQHQLEEWRRRLDQEEITAQARARGETLQTVPTEVSDWLRSEMGEIVRKDGLPVLVTETARAKRRAGSDARARLESLGGFDDRQIRAGARFEGEWEAAHMEPRVTANLVGTGGGRGVAIAETLQGAKDTLRATRVALAKGGADVLATVESIIVLGSSLQSAGERRYVSDTRHNDMIKHFLEVGLNLLAGHYGFGAKAPERILEGEAA